MIDAAISDALASARLAMTSHYGETVLYYPAGSNIPLSYTACNAGGVGVERPYNMLAGDTGGVIHRWLILAEDVVRGDYYMDSSGERWDVVAALYTDPDGWTTLYAIKHIRYGD